MPGDDWGVTLCAAGNGAYCSCRTSARGAQRAGGGRRPQQQGGARGADDPCVFSGGGARFFVWRWAGSSFSKSAMSHMSHLSHITKWAVSKIGATLRANGDDLSKCLTLVSRMSHDVSRFRPQNLASQFGSGVHALFRSGRLGRPAHVWGWRCALWRFLGLFLRVVTRPGSW